MADALKIMNKNFEVGYYDKTKSIQISQEKGNEDERQSSIKSRPEKRVTKTKCDLYIMEEQSQNYFYGCSFSG